MSAYPPRRLPVSVPPFSHETVDSYLDRLAAANHLDPATLRDHLHEPSTPGPLPAPHRLAAVSGRPLATLRGALIELRLLPPASANWSRWHPLVRAGYRPALVCQRCAARRGITRPIFRWVPHHLNVCLRHRRWLGLSARKVAEQLDLTRSPEVTRAARRHHNLIRRRGHAPVRFAYHDSLHITQRWAERGDFSRHRNRRLDQLCHPDRRSLPFDDPALDAATYPDTVALTSLLSSAHWVGAAASKSSDHRRQFYKEAARRLELPECTPRGAFDPLIRWATHDADWILNELCKSTTPEGSPLVSDHDAKANRSR